MIFIKQVLLFVLLMTLFGLSSCMEDNTKPDLVVINGPEPQSLDPALFVATSDRNIVRELFEGLLRFDRFGKPQPGVASSWEISKDRKTYTFHLRPEAQWSHYLPVTADDFVYSWKRILSPKTAASFRYAFFLIEGAENFAHGKTDDFSTVGIKALNEQTLEIRLKEPTPYFLEFCASPVSAPVPRALIESQGDSWIAPFRIEGKDNYSVISNGPYLLSSWRVKDKIILKKNPFYWDAAHVDLKTIHIPFIGNPEVAYRLYSSGEVDVILDELSEPSPALIEGVSKKSDLHQAPKLETFFLRFNCYDEPFNDPRVRKAFALCVNRDLLARVVPNKMVLPTASMVPSGIYGYQPLPGIGYNPRLAQQLLSEAGYPGGKDFPIISYLYLEGEFNQSVALGLQAMWKKNLGVNIVLKSQDWKAYLKSASVIDSLSVDCGIISCQWVAESTDPSMFLDFFASNDRLSVFKWSSFQYNHYMRQTSTELDPAKRFALIHKAEKLLICEEVPVIPIFHFIGINIYDSNKIDGIKDNLLDIHPLWQMSRKKSPFTDHERE